VRLPALIGAMRDRSDEVTTDEVRAARISAARSNPRWTELEAVDLVARGPFLVAASTDLLYARHRVVFEPGSASVFATAIELHFYIDDGDVVFLESVPGTWITTRRPWSDTYASSSRTTTRQAA
jgi:hypothetical protein